MIRKRTVMRIAFSAEVLFFSWFYYYGVCGIRDIERLHIENQQFDAKIEAINREIACKKQECVAWQTDPFYREKLAREQLHMAREGEEIYLVNQQLHEYTDLSKNFM